MASAAVPPTPGPWGDLEPPADEELARRAALGDRDAFVAIVDRHGPALYRYARHLLSDDADAEDCVQEALSAAWIGLEGFRGESSLKTWLFGIEANVVRRHLRRRPPAPVELVLDLPGPPDETDPVAHLLGTNLRAALTSALQALPPLQRACWLLSAVEGMSYDDIAATQATTPTVVRGQLARARRTLEKRFETWR